MSGGESLWPEGIGPRARLRLKADGRVYRRERCKRGWGWKLVGIVVRTKGGQLFGRVTFGWRLG